MDEQPPSPDDSDPESEREPGPPNEPFAAPPPPPHERRRRSGAARVVVALLTALAVFVVAVAVWGFVHHPGYDQFLPGEAEAVGPLISVDGARQYASHGDVYLVFVRERQNLNEWQYLWARAFPGDSDVRPSPPASPSTSSQQDVCDMADSQSTAKFVALEKLGYKVPTKPGVVVTSVGGGIPAADVLRCDDVILSVDGKPTNTPDALRNIVTSHKSGDVAEVTFERAGQRFTRGVKLVKDPNFGNTVIGVLPADQWVYPVKLNIDTRDIGGPSAGLAMTLALLDQLTPGNLTGGKRVAVTGTINPDATVGEIGEIRLKAIAARARGVQVFIVPACTADQGAVQSCKQDLAAAAKEARGVKVIPVRNLDEALRALAANGGDPLPAKTAPVAQSARTP